MKFSILTSALFVVAGLASPLQDVRRSVGYGFKSVQAYNAKDKIVHRIVKEDTGADSWVCTKSLPPSCYTPPMSEKGIKKLRAVRGVEVFDLDD